MGFSQYTRQIKLLIQFVIIFSELNVMFESQNVTFSNDVDVIKCIPVMVIDDSLIEGTETIVFSLFSTDDDVTINRPVQSFVLRDNDSEIYNYKCIGVGTGRFQPPNSFQYGNLYIDISNAINNHKRFSSMYIY